MYSFFYGIIGGVVAWLTTTLIGQPIFSFLNLRYEAARLIALYERDDPLRGPVRGADSIEWLAQRKRAYEECGSRLVGFEISNSFIASFLFRVGFYPKSAGESLMLLAELSPGQPMRSTIKDQIVSGLKLKTWV